MRTEPVGTGAIFYYHADLRPGTIYWDRIAERIPKQIAMVFGFPPCTDLAASGALHWKGKARLDPDFQIKAADMAKQAARFADSFGAPYVVENPKGALSRLWRKPDLTFDPCDYGGYLPEDDRHPRWPRYIAPRDAYTKETHSWVGNGYIEPPKMRVRPEIIERETASGKIIRGSRQFMMLGGSSLKTKNIRNETPRGWAQAVYCANSERARIG